VLVDNEEATLAKLNWLCGAKKNIFLKTKVPKHRNLVVSPKVDKNIEETIEEDATTQGGFGNEMSTTKSKILTHFQKGKISFTPLETNLTIPSELEYLERLVELARRRKDEEA